MLGHIPAEGVDQDIHVRQNAHRDGADAKQSTMDRLQRALEAAGVKFTNGDQPGVRLTKVAAAHSVEFTKGIQSKLAKTVRDKTAKATEKKR